VELLHLFWVNVIDIIKQAMPLDDNTINSSGILALANRSGKESVLCCLVESFAKCWRGKKVNLYLLILSYWCADMGI
jgi:hypothetical protein